MELADMFWIILVVIFIAARLKGWLDGLVKKASPAEQQHRRREVRKYLRDSLEEVRETRAAQQRARQPARESRRVRASEKPGDDQTLPVLAAADAYEDTSDRQAEMLARYDRLQHETGPEGHVHEHAMLDDLAVDEHYAVKEDVAPRAVMFELPARLGPVARAMVAYEIFGLPRAYTDYHTADERFFSEDNLI